MLTYDHIEQFEQDGFVAVEDMFSLDEVELVLREIEWSRDAVDKTRDMPDAAGRPSRAALWLEMPDSVFGLVTSTPRLVNSARALMRDDVYHWHSKIKFKEARSSGSWKWHQDYGFWYQAGCLLPRMVSAFVVLDQATRENGCIRYLRCSHRCGRIDHMQVSGQTVAEPERLRQLKERFPVVDREAAPGTVIFHHCNTLHSSLPNNSDHHRRAYVVCYNALSNESVDRQIFPAPEPWAEGASDPDAIRNWARTRTATT